MQIISIDEMREIEVIAREKYGLNESLIIENVGSQGAYYIHNHYSKLLKISDIVVLVGRGNNGADGVALARHLQLLGYDPSIILCFDKHLWSKELGRVLDMAQAYQLNIKSIKDYKDLEDKLNKNKKLFVIDSLFGTGIKLPITDKIADIINLINEKSDFIFSIDIPSGVHGDTGKIDSTSIMAQMTYSIGAYKYGHFISDGGIRKGKLELCNGGFPKQIFHHRGAKYLSLNLLPTLFKKRSLYGHKNNFGHIGVIGGSQGLTGAISLASQAGLRSGVGLCTAYTWKDQFYELCTHQPPDVMKGIIPEDEESMLDFIKILEKKHNTLVVGPGMGREPKVREFVLDLINKFKGYLVIDADAINAIQFTRDKKILKKRTFPTLLTPHIGEMAQFLNIDKSSLVNDPLYYLRQVVNDTGVNILLKNYYSILTLVDDDQYFLDYPNSALARGGSGDILSGLIGGYCVQEGVSQDSYSYKNAILKGMLTHTWAGQKALSTKGSRALLSSEILDSLTNICKDVKLNYL